MLRVVGPEALPAGGIQSAPVGPRGRLRGRPPSAGQVLRLPKWTDGLTLCGVSVVWNRWRSGWRVKAGRRVDRPLRAMSWWPVTLLAVVVVLGGGAVAMWLLGVWSPIPADVPDPQRLRLDRIKTALTVTAGLAAGVTLLMTLRRQAWSEHAQQFTQADAVEQRITALYVAAAEQLGSDKAAVRLAGLYALERLGQDNPKLRQTVVEVLCAYLRMPYTPPVEVLRGNTAGSPQHVASDAPVPEPEEQQRRREELQVRLTAQRLITNHLRLSGKTDDPEPATYWRSAADERMNLDLVGATLVNFSLLYCHADRLDLTAAQFHGYASLSEAQFHGSANLSEAQFHGYADLSEAQFHGKAYLGSAQFHGNANLSQAQFHEDTSLSKAQFHGYANLTKAQFHENAELNNAQVHGNAYLDKAQFHGHAHLNNAQFHGSVGLSEAQFHENAYLRKAQFHGHADLDQAQFHGHANLSKAQFQGNADLSNARFHGHANLSEAQFHGNADLSNAQFHGNANLDKAQFHGKANLNEAQFDRGVGMPDGRATPAARLPKGWVLGNDTDTAGNLRSIIRAANTTPASNDHARPAGESADTGSEAT